MKPTHLDLFSGIGGFALAAGRAGFETVAFSEIEPYACKILKQHWPGVPNLGDIRNVTAAAVADAISLRQSQSEGSEQDKRGRTCNCGGRKRIQPKRGLKPDGGPQLQLLTGGFPCQPFSVAGKRRGSEDDRALWPEMHRVVAETRPRWVLAENVPGIIGMELDTVLSDLEAIGYATGTLVVPACAVDARHRRERVWIVGNSASEGSLPAALGGIHRGEETPGTRDEELVRRSDVAYADEPGSQGRGRLLERADERPAWQDSWSEHCQWLPEPELGRVAHGIPYRAHRLKGLGNAIVPQVAEVILKHIKQLIDHERNHAQAKEIRKREADSGGNPEDP